MYFTRKEAIDDAYIIYTNIQENIRKMYGEAEKFDLILPVTLEDILYDMEEYIQQALKTLSIAEGNRDSLEENLINKLHTIESKPINFDSDEFLDNFIEKIPTGLKLAKAFDDKAQTRYAYNMVKAIEEICQILENLDGSSDREEYKFRSPLIEGLRGFIKEE